MDNVIDYLNQMFVGTFLAVKKRIVIILVIKSLNMTWITIRKWVGG